MRSDLAPTPLYELALLLAAGRVPRLSKRWNALTVLSAMAREQRLMYREQLLCN
jgi:hypothetical protein